MNYLLVTFVFIFLTMWTCSNIRGKNYDGTNNLTNTTEVRTVLVTEVASSGLDLEALPSIIQTSKTAAELESLLNEQGGVNNLDLDNDGVVDFIKVTEFSEGKVYGYSLTTEPEAGEEQEIATIEITEESGSANVNVAGNKQIYGTGTNYNSSFPIGTFLMMSYLLSPHPFYASPYGYGAYPGYYRPYTTLNSSNYRQQTQEARQNSATRRGAGTTIKSPNAGKTANSGIRKKLQAPTSSQKAFQVRDSAKKIGTGGFGRSVRSTGSSRNFASSASGFGGFGK